MTTRCSARRHSVCLTLAVAVAATWVSATAASAQLFVIGSATLEQVPRQFQGGAAFDPVHDCFFAVSVGNSVRGFFINRAGYAIAAPLRLAGSEAGLVSRVAYSPDLPDGQGGFGAFIVIWADEPPGGRVFVGRVIAQIVAYPGRLVGPRVTIFASPLETAHRLAKADIAYSPSDRVFLVALGLSIAGRGIPSRLVRLNLAAQPIGEIPLSSDPNPSCATSALILECSEVRVVWNQVSGEFGALYVQGLVTATSNTSTIHTFDRILARVRGDGTIVRRTALGIGENAGALAVNSATGNYLAVGGSSNNVTDGAEVDTAGNLVARGPVTSSLSTQLSLVGSMELSYSLASGTFLLVGRSAVPFEERMLELNQHGVALSSILDLPEAALSAGWSSVARHDAAPEWFVGVGLNSKIVGTATPFGGSGARLPGCVTVKPGADWVCVNGGWLPPDMPAPPEPPLMGGCAPPDPFVALGRGTCANGGWLPPGIPPPAPPTPSPRDPSGCASVRPGPDWVCVNGGWLPPGIAPSNPPPPAPGPPSECVTVRPGPDWVCVNGGWVPGAIRTAGAR